jgi:hypothetical protein
MTVVTMSRAEFSRLQVMIDLADDRLTVDAAGELLGLGRRQTYRVLAAFRAQGPGGLISRQRGRRSNRAYGPAFRKSVLWLVRDRYHDFGPTLAAEKLAQDGLHVGVETLRQWMIADGLWIKRKERKRVHQPRPRRDCLGELIQIDGSEHWWFEDRGPQCTLLVYVDDATSRLMQLKFVESESAFDYFNATREYLEAHGKPVAFYSDKHSVFRVTNRQAVGGDGMTQFGRALQDLNIEIICANSSQAKGRVERAHKTLQDRLVKELRLQEVCTIEAANRRLPAFLADYNKRFAKPAHNPKDLHRPLTGSDNLDEAFAWREERTVSESLTLQYDKVVFLLEPSEIAFDARRKRVTVIDYPDGRLAIRHKGVELAYSTFDKLRSVTHAAVVDNKRLSAALEFIRDEQQQAAPARRSQHAPRRRGQLNHIFKVG